MQKHGSTMLKVTSILMIVFAALGLVVDISTIAGYSWIWDYDGKYGIDLTLFTIALILLVVAVVVELAAGIVGVINWDKREKAGLCMMLGVAVIVLVVVGNVLSIVAVNKLYSSIGYGSGDTSTLFTGFLGLIIPVLYVIGASQLKNMPDAGVYSAQNGYGQNPYMQYSGQNPYMQGQGGYTQGQNPYMQGNGNNPGPYQQGGYSQGQNPYTQGQGGYTQGQNPYMQGNYSNPGYQQGQNPYAQNGGSADAGGSYGTGNTPDNL